MERGGTFGSQRAAYALEGGGQMEKRAGNVNTQAAFGAWANLNGTEGGVRDAAYRKPTHNV